DRSAGGPRASEPRPGAALERGAPEPRGADAPRRPPRRGERRRVPAPARAARTPALDRAPRLGGAAPRPLRDLLRLALPLLRTLLPQQLLPQAPRAGPASRGARLPGVRDDPALAPVSRRALDRARDPAPRTGAPGRGARARSDARRPLPRLHGARRRR